LKIQEKKIQVMTADRCVMCGGVIPEGQQVCGLCKHKTELGKRGRTRWLNIEANTRSAETASTLKK